MYDSIGKSLTQLVPSHLFTGIATALAEADAGKRVLYLATTERQVLRMTQVDPERAATFKDADDDTRIFCATHRTYASGVAFDCAVVDIFETEKLNPEQMDRVVSELETEQVFMNRSGGWFQNARAVGAVRAYAGIAAEAVDRPGYYGYCSADESLWFHRSSNLAAWEAHRWEFTTEPRDMTAPVETLKERSVQIRVLVRNALIEQAREYPKIKEVESFIGRELTDEEVEEECRDHNMLVYRALLNRDWAKGQQQEELHRPSGEGSVDFNGYAMDRLELYTRAVYFEQLLRGAGVWELFAAGVDIIVSRLNDVGVRRAFMAMDRVDQNNFLRLIQPNHARAFRELIEPTASADDTERVHLTPLILGLCGLRQSESFETAINNKTGRIHRTNYVFVHDDALLERANANYGAKCPNPPTNDSIYKSLYCHLREQNALLSQSDDSSVVKSIISSMKPAFVADLGAIMRIGKVIKGDGHDGQREAAYNAVKRWASLGPGYLLCIPPVAKAPAHRPQGRVQNTFTGQSAQVQNISGDKDGRPGYRRHLYALPGHTLINYDLKNAHLRIAAHLCRDFDTDGKFADYCWQPDVYKALADVTGITRAQAKIVSVGLLNNGRTPMLLSKGIAKQDAPKILASWDKLAKPFIKWGDAGHKSDPFINAKGESNGRVWANYEIEKLEARMLDATIKLIAKRRPDIRLLVPMYDGALFDVDTTNPLFVEEAKQAIKECAEEVSKSFCGRMIPVEVGSGRSWGEAEGK